MCILCACVFWAVHLICSLSICDQLGLVNGRNERWKLGDGSWELGAGLSGSLVMGISCHYNYSKGQRLTAGLKIFVSSFFTAGFTTHPVEWCVKWGAVGGRQITGVRGNHCEDGLPWWWRRQFFFGIVCVWWIFARVFEACVCLVKTANWLLSPSDCPTSHWHPLLFLRPCSWWVGEDTGKSFSIFILLQLYSGCSLFYVIFMVSNDIYFLFY